MPQDASEQQLGQDQELHQGRKGVCEDEPRLQADGSCLLQCASVSNTVWVLYASGHLWLHRHRANNVEPHQPECGGGMTRGCCATAVTPAGWACCLQNHEAVNVDEFKLTGGTLKSVNKEVDEEEEMLYAELYKELEETERRISRTRRGRGGREGSGKVKGKGKGKGKGRGGTSTSMRRGSSSASPTATSIEEEDDMMPFIEGLREPEYDDDGNLLSEGDFIFDLETEEEDYASEDFLASDHSSDEDSFTISP